MPCLLKQKTADSPGIISFTNNEVLGGIVANSKKIQSFLRSVSTSGEWLFGVHVQGYCGFLPKWPIQPWESFYLWTEPEAKFLANVPREAFLPMNCINFMPDGLFPDSSGRKKQFDVCVISHPTVSKATYDSLMMVRRAMAQKKDFTAVFIVPDPRDQNLGAQVYEKLGLDRRFFEMPLRLFSSQELKQLNFVCSSTLAFGRLPLSAEFVWDILAQSRFLLSLSKFEGTPRIFAESLLSGTPCAIAEDCEFGMRRAHNPGNTLWLSSDPEKAVTQLLGALGDYGKFHVDLPEARAHFGETKNLPVLRDFLSGLIEAKRKPVQGEWYLNELPLRLPCHGQKLNYQLMHNDRLFFDWFENVQKYNPDDEDRVLGLPPLDDLPSLTQRSKLNWHKFKGSVKRVLR